MTTKYYLARLLGGSLQYSDEYCTSYRKAIQLRNKQVNPGQWLIVLNPYIPKYNGTRLNLQSTRIKQQNELSEAFKMLGKVTNIVRSLTN